jgi:hypothetical protein
MVSLEGFEPTWTPLGEVRLSTRLQGDRIVRTEGFEPSLTWV